MYHHSRTPLRVPIVAIFITLFAILLFGGASRAVPAAISAQQPSGVAVASNAAAGSNCHSRPISAEEIQTSLKTLDGSSTYTAYEAVEFSISLTLEEGHCAGDSITISVPSELGTDGSFEPIPMTTPEPSVSPSQSPVPSAAKSPSLVPLPESSTQPSADNNTGRLAKTGASVSAGALAVMLIAFGVVLAAVAKVRKARSDG